jgi:hypothetical protein
MHAPTHVRSLPQVVHNLYRVHESKTSLVISGAVIWQPRFHYKSGEFVHTQLRIQTAGTLSIQVQTTSVVFGALVSDTFSSTPSSYAS